MVLKKAVEKQPENSQHIYISDEDESIPRDPSMPTMVNVIVTKPNLINQVSAPLSLKKDENALETNSNDGSAKVNH